MSTKDGHVSIHRIHRRSREFRDIHWGVCVYLLDGPRTLEEIRTSYERDPFPFSQQPGFFVRGNWAQRGLDQLKADLAGLILYGWVMHVGDQYILTGCGRRQFNRMMEQVQSSLEGISHQLDSLLHPQVASKMTLIVQAILASVKLPAGLLSGSIGLLNDAIDTLLDLLSSLLVYCGVRFNKERLASIFMVIFMLATGGFALYEAIHRCFTPYVPVVDWFPFAAALLSALTGLVLWTYQRYVGLRSGSMAFVAESVDSRNHVIVAMSVTAGLVASLMHFGLLDMLVGLVVALLILWSAIELAIDLARSSGKEPVNQSHYGFWLRDVYEHFRNAHLRDLMLNLVDCHEVQTRDDLVACARRAFDFRENRWMKLFGLDRQFADDPVIDQVLSDLFSRGWLVDQNPLLVSKKGEEILKGSSRHHRML